MTTLLHERAEEYLRLRRALGFRLDYDGYRLSQFADYLQQHGASRSSPRSTRSRGRSCRRESPRGPGPSGLPPSAGSRPGCAPSIPPRRSRPGACSPGYGRRPAPFIFTDDDIAAMHAACGSLRPWFRSATYTALFGLIAVTGIRIGEALAIPVGGIDLDAGLLPVHPAKSRCERILPLHPTTVAALADYEELRARKHPKATTFFMSIRGTRLCHHPVLNAFREICDLAGIPGRPRIHDAEALCGRLGYAPCRDVSAGRGGGARVAVRIILLGWGQRPSESSQPSRDESEVQSGKASGVSGS